MTWRANATNGAPRSRRGPHPRLSPNATPVRHPPGRVPRQLSPRLHVHPVKRGRTFTTPIHTEYGSRGVGSAPIPARHFSKDTRKIEEQKDGNDYPH